VQSEQGSAAAESSRSPSSATRNSSTTDREASSEREEAATRLASKTDFEDDSFTGRDAMAEIETVQVPDGARCAQHPDVAAVIVCTRCASYACLACTRGHSARAYCTQCVDMLPELASETTRLLAMMVDGVLIGAPMTAAAAAGLILGYEVDAGDDKLGAISRAVMGIGALGTLAVLGVNLRLVSKYGQSIAKRWFGLQVVRSDGSRADVSRIVLLRNALPMLIGAVPLVGSFFQLVDALFIFRKDRRCIHDHMADTIVVRVKQRAREASG
jgi:uncharacterized RDD family membrane protein YckC